MSTAVAEYPHALSLDKQEERLGICRDCLIEKPLSQFRHWRRKNGRLYVSRQCKACHSRRETERCRSKTVDRKHRVLYESWGRFASAEKKRLSVERLACDLLARLGGEKEVGRIWHEAVMAATHVRRIRASESLVAIMRYLEQNPSADRDPRQMSDSDLQANYEAELAKTIRSAIQEHPEIVSAAADISGYRFTKL